MPIRQIGTKKSQGGEDRKTERKTDRKKSGPKQEERKHIQNPVTWNPKCNKRGRKINPQTIRPFTISINVSSSSIHLVASFEPKTIFRRLELELGSLGATK